NTSLRISPGAAPTAIRMPISCVRRLAERAITNAASGCVPLLACLNLANVLGARGVRRQREFAIRASLGAGSRRLFRQLLTEHLVISGLGGAIGFLAATWAIRVFLGLFNVTVYLSLPRHAEIGLDWRVLVFTAFACLLTALLFSLVSTAGAIREVWLA